MKKSILSLLFLGICPFWTYANDGDYNGIETLISIIACLLSLAFCILFIWGIILFIKKNNQGGKKKIKYSLYICLVVLILGYIGSEMDTDSSADSNKGKTSTNSKKNDDNEIYLNSGYTFVLSHLKSPSSTSLLESQYGVEVKKVVEEHLRVTLPQRITVGFFTVDTPNSFGTLLRETFFVFYSDGKPCHLETSKSLDETAAYPNAGTILLSALKINGCNCD